MKNSSITVNKSGNIICDNSDKILRQSAREFPLAGEVSLFVLIRPSTDWVRPTHIMGFPGSSAGKESACNAGDPGSIPGSGRSPGERIGYPFQYSWPSLMAQVVESSLQCGRPGFNPWVGKIPWRREWLPTPVPIPVSGLENSMDSMRNHKELDTTERLSLSLFH